MALYYFDLVENGVSTRDEDGTDFSSLPEVRAQAARTLAEMAVDLAPPVDDHATTMNVRDLNGLVVVRATIRLEVH